MDQPAEHDDGHPGQAGEEGRDKGQDGGHPCVVREKREEVESIAVGETISNILQSHQVDNRLDEDWKKLIAV